MRIVITDIDHASVDVEREVAAARGVDLTVAQCRTEEDVIEAGAGAHGLIVQYAPITRKVFEALPELRAVGRYGVGVDTIDVPAATEHGVLVTNVPDYGTEEVSDHAISLALSAARGITHLDRTVRGGDYSLEPAQPLFRLRDRVFAVVGLGNIGAATARKAKGVGFRVIGSDPALTTGSMTAEGVEVADFEDLLARADIISLHAPLTRGTHHLIGADALSTMQCRTILVNTSRGPLVDTAALVEALSEGRIGGAALDVFEEEPLPDDSTLRELANVILTPHAAWYSEESYVELKRRVIENVADACAGEPVRNMVNQVPRRSPMTAGAGKGARA